MAPIKYSFTDNRSVHFRFLLHINKLNRVKSKNQLFMLAHLHALKLRTEFILNRMTTKVLQKFCFKFHSVYCG